MAEEKQSLSPQSIERAKVAAEIMSLFDRVRENRDKPFALFRDRTLKNYIDDNTKRFVQFKRRPPHKKFWQSNLASTTPNEKLIGILSKLATRGMEARVVSTKDISFEEMMKEKISNSLLKAAAIKNEDDFQIILEMLDACEKGTVIGMEDWFFGKRKIREITKQDTETGELQFKEKTIKGWNDVRSRLINLEDFYPSSVYVRPGKIQDLDFCFYRQILTKEEFKAEFGKFKDADKVETLQDIVGQINGSTPFWKQSPDVGVDKVEVLFYFNQRKDEYVILANQIWINPKGKDIISPLPYNHKRLPFWAAVFEPLDTEFFYGRSFIDKLISITDSKDALFDRILDQMTLAVSKPIITNGSAASALTKGFLQPNNVISTDWSEGRPKFDVVPISDPPAMAISLYQILQNNEERATISTEVLGGESTKRKTATEISAQMQGAIETMSLFLKLMETGIREKNRLRFSNILQFYTMPVHSEDDDLRFKKVILRNEKLSNGRIGNLQITITNETSQENVMNQKNQVPTKSEFIEVTPSFIRDFEAEIEIVPQSSVKMTELQRQVLELNYQKVITELYADKYNRDFGFDQLNLVFSKDPREARATTPAQATNPMAMAEGRKRPSMGVENMQDIPGIPAMETALE